MTPLETKIVREWLEIIDIPLGSVDKWGEMKRWGVTSHHGARKIANLVFFKKLEESLPKWPWPFKPVPQRASFNF